MLGYLILDRDFCPDETIRHSISNLATFSLRGCHELDDARVYLIENRYPNNYLYDSPRLLLVATGTFIYRHSRGNDALKQLGAAMAQDRSIEDEYSDFHGPYTLIVLDRDRKRLCVVTDREGLQHCFVGTRHGATAFSSNQLLLASISDAALHPDAVREFVHIGRCFDGKTLFRNVERLPAATKLTRENGKWRPQRLWKIRVETPCLPDAYPQALEKTSGMLENAVRMAGTVEPGRLVADLTGGADTRTVLSFLLRQHPQLTVTAGGAADHVDIILSKKLAAKLGRPHFWNPQDRFPALSQSTLSEVVEIADGNSNPFGILQFLDYFNERSRRFDIDVGGNGGPLFKDHYWLFEFNRTGLNREPNWQRIANLSVVNYVVQDDFFIGSNSRIMVELSAKFLEHSKQIIGTNNQKLDYVYFDYKVPVVTGSWLTMVNQFHDVYHPLLDGQSVQYAMNIDPRIRKYNKLLFGMIYRNNRTLAWSLTDTGVPAIPPIGRFAPLKALAVRRYARSAFRKLKTFGLKRADRSSAHPVDQVADSLWSAGYFDLLDYEQMAIAPIVSRERLAAMLKEPKQGSNQTYLMNALAVELFAKRVAELSGRPVAGL